MIEFFANLYEWFGLILFYSKDMGDQLRGWDITCSDYIGMPWYVFIGSIMLFITCFMYTLQYHIIDSSSWNKKKDWWIFAIIIVALNFLIAFAIPFNILQAGDFCNQLNLTISDCFGFGFSNALWSFILFVLLTSFPFPRKVLPSRSGNCRHTTFWKP